MRKVILAFASVSYSVALNSAWQPWRVLGSAVLSLTKSGESRGGGKSFSSLCRHHEGIWCDDL